MKVQHILTALPKKINVHLRIHVLQDSNHSMYFDFKKINLDCMSSAKGHTQSPLKGQN